MTSAGGGLRAAALVFRVRAARCGSCVRAACPPRTSGPPSTSARRGCVPRASTFASSRECARRRRYVGCDDLPEGLAGLSEADAVVAVLDGPMVDDGPAASTGSVRADDGTGQEKAQHGSCTDPRQNQERPASAPGARQAGRRPGALRPPNSRSPRSGRGAVPPPTRLSRFTLTASNPRPPPSGDPRRSSRRSGGAAQRSRRGRARSRFDRSPAASL